MKAMLAALAVGLLAGGFGDAAPAQETPSSEAEAIGLHYLEIVTTEVDATCEALAAQHGVTFSDPQPALGFARVAELTGGGRIGVRAPLSEDEDPIVRPYTRVDDIAAAIAAAEAAGGEFAMFATDIPGQGQFAIYVLGGVQHAIWEP